VTWHDARGRTILLGTTLVLALVALQPVALGFFPVGTAGSDAGIGTGTGDLAAGALSALVRDLNSEASAPPQSMATASVVFVPLGTYDDLAACRMRAGAVEHADAGTTLTGTAGHGYPLLL